MSVPYNIELTVKPNRRRYVHRSLVTAVDGAIMDEQGLIHSDIPAFVLSAKEPFVFVTLDPYHLLGVLDEAFRDMDPVPVKIRGEEILQSPWQFKMIRTGDREATGRVERTRLDRFGVIVERARRKAMHMVWCPSDMSPSGDTSFIKSHTHVDIMRWAKDFRDFHKANDLPLSTTFPGVAAKLLRDDRFYPDDRRQVPRATNERARQFLPGVHQEARADFNRTHKDVVALDQRRAYHHIVQETPLPNANNLFARGFFSDPMEADEYWCKPGDELYDRTVQQPGLIFIGAHNTKSGKKGDLPFAPPALNFRGFTKLAVWTNELPMMESLGLRVDGIYAALTSTTADEGLARYGAWALDTIDNANEDRAGWMKPTLHAAYGILGSRPRKIKMGFRVAVGGEDKEYIYGPRVFNVKHVETTQALQAPTANVVMLGVIQAEVRRRTIALANALRDLGVEVTHLHADGLHVVGQLPLTIPNSWSVKAISNVRYLDRVSWTSDQGDCLPGRSREDIAIRRHRAHIVALRAAVHARRR